jgi:hypothetical protein
MSRPFPPEYLIGILFTDIVGPILAVGVNDYQLLGPGKALQASFNRPTIVGSEDIYGYRDLFDYAIHPMPLIHRTAIQFQKSKPKNSPTTKF